MFGFYGCYNGFGGTYRIAWLGTAVTADGFFVFMCGIFVIINNNFAVIGRTAGPIGAETARSYYRNFNS